MTDPAESFAADRPLLVGGGHRSPVFVTVAADSLSASGLERLQDLGRGPALLALQHSALERLGVAASPRARRPGLALAFTSSIDAAWLRHRGSSLSDRALTMRVASGSAADARDVVTPGHVQPVGIGDHDLL